MSVGVTNLSLAARRPAPNWRRRQGRAKRARFKRTDRRDIERACARGLELAINTLAGTARVGIARMAYNETNRGQSNEMFEHNFSFRPTHCKGDDVNDQ
jgi:hypothetical protein